MQGFTTCSINARLKKGLEQFTVPSGSVTHPKPWGVIIEWNLAPNVTSSYSALKIANHAMDVALANTNISNNPCGLCFTTTDYSR